MSDAPPFPLAIAGYDGSSRGRDALALATLLAGGRVVAARVFPAEPWFRHRSKHAQEQQVHLEDLREAAAAVGAEPEQPVARSPGAGLHDLALELDASLLVVGSSEGDDPETPLVGTTAERLLHGAPCAVAVAPHGFRQREQLLRVVGVGYDGSPEAEIALENAIRLAEDHQSTMRIFTVLPSTTTQDEELARARRNRYDDISRAAQEKAPERLRAAALVVPGHPAAVLREEAGKGLDLLAVGSRAYGPVRRTFAGSVAAHLMHGLPCPLLVFPRGAEPPGPVERLAVPDR